MDPIAAAAWGRAAVLDQFRHERFCRDVNGDVAGIVSPAGGELVLGEIRGERAEFVDDVRRHGAREQSFPMNGFAETLLIQSRALDIDVAKVHESGDGWCAGHRRIAGLPPEAPEAHRVPIEGEMARMGCDEQPLDSEEPGMLSEKPHQSHADVRVFGAGERFGGETGDLGQNVPLAAHCGDFGPVNGLNGQTVLRVTNQGERSDDRILKPGDDGAGRWEQMVRSDAHPAGAVLRKTLAPIAVIDEREGRAPFVQRSGHLAAEADQLVLSRTILSCRAHNRRLSASESRRVATIHVGWESKEM